MAELNHDTIKTQIVAILKANGSLYTTTAEANKLRAIEVGFPSTDFNSGQLSDAMLPYCYVTNSAGPFETITTGQVTGNAIQTLAHTIHYDIVFVTLEHDSRKAESELDTYQKLILDTLEVDHNLTGVTSAVVDDSNPVRVEPLGLSPRDRGRGIKGRVITFRCIKRTGQTQMADLGALTEIVNSPELSLEVGSDEYIMLTDLQIDVRFTETRKPVTSGNSVYVLGKGDHTMTFTLVVTTPEITTLNNLVGPDADGDHTSTAWKVVAKDVSAATKTLACTGYLRDYTIRKGGVENTVEIDCFVRITTNTVTVT